MSLAFEVHGLPAFALSQILILLGCTVWGLCLSLGFGNKYHRPRVQKTEITLLWL